MENYFNFIKEGKLFKNSILSTKVHLFCISLMHGILDRTVICKMKPNAICVCDNYFANYFTIDSVSYFVFSLFHSDFIYMLIFKTWKNLIGSFRDLNNQTNIKFFKILNSLELLCCAMPMSSLIQNQKSSIKTLSVYFLQGLALNYFGHVCIYLIALLGGLNK